MRAILLARATEARRADLRSSSFFNHSAVPGALLWSCAPNPGDPDGGLCVREDGSGMTLGHTGEGHGPGDPRGDVNQFLSQHGRGSFFLYCDGHVRFLRNEMNYQLYKALSTYPRDVASASASSAASRS